MAEAHEIIDISSDEEESFGEPADLSNNSRYNMSLSNDEWPEPGYSPASPSDSDYNMSRSDSDEYPEPGYSPASPSYTLHNNTVSDSDEYDFEEDSAGINLEQDNKINLLIAENEKSTAESHQFSRSCPVCLIENPNRRAVFLCGHIICLACAESLKNDAIREEKALQCPMCRAETEFIPMFETRQ